MGETSKTSGEIGESIAKAMIELIGWKHSTSNMSIRCHIKNHLNAEGAKRTTHGEDRIFTYSSPFHDDQTVVVHISVKNSIKPAPSVATLRRLFKQYYTDLQETIECASLDPEVHKLVNARRPRKHVKHIGLLLWRFSDVAERSLLDELAVLELPTGYKNPVFLLDNSRQEFLFSALRDFRARSGVESPNYYYPNLGAKLSVDDRRIGDVLPVELASSGIVPLLTRSESGQVLYIYADQEFSLDHYRQLINYALQMSQDLVHDIRIGMPDYDPTEHSGDAATARAFFDRRRETVLPFSFAPRSANLLEAE